MTNYTDAYTTLANATNAYNEEVDGSPIVETRWEIATLVQIAQAKALLAVVEELQLARTGGKPLSGKDMWALVNRAQMVTVDGKKVGK